MGLFYRGLRRLGVDLATYTSRGKEEFTCEQIRSHFANIGATPNEVVVTQLGLPEARPQCEELGLPPSDAEIDGAWQKMRASAGGHDEVRIELIRLGAPPVRDKLRVLIRRLWTSPAEEWEASVSVAVGIVLYKQKGSARDLDNYRLISLLTLVSRTMARSVSQRLSRYGEDQELFLAKQWGFRTHRGTLGAIFSAGCEKDVRRLVSSLTYTTTWRCSTWSGRCSQQSSRLRRS